MNVKKPVAFLAVITVLTAVLAACGGTALGSYETPKYTVEGRQDRMEIRTYPPMLVAEAETKGERREAINSGFRLVADFIFGNNTTAQKVSMTTPVLQSESQKIDMTTPVLQSGQSGVWVTQFVMPSKFTMDTLPKPNNPAVKIRMTDPKKYAVITFSGFASESNLASHEKKLRAYMERNRLIALAPASYAFYDPPWTLPFMRRNEVMIEVK